MDKKIIEELVNRYGDELDDRKFDNIIYGALEKNVYDDLMTIFAGAGISVSSGVTTLPYNFHLDEAQIPPYLRNAHFVAWLKKFKQSVEDKKLPTCNYSRFNVTVKFSNDKKTRRYGSLSIEELKKIIRDTWGKHKEIEEILSGIKTKEDYRNARQILYSALRRLRLDEKRRDPEEIYSYLDELEFETAVLGEYIHDDRLIVLYTLNIEHTAIEHKNSSSREFEKVFIHELFHAYHYNNGKDEIVNRIDYTSKVVKESLASAFEWYYCTENGINGVDELRASWCDHSVLFYPYSGAHKLVAAMGGTSIRYKFEDVIFARVFDESLSDMDSALRKLLSSYEFYKIKNSCQVREKYIKNNVVSSDLRTAFDELMKKDKISVIAQREIPSIIRQSKNRGLIPQLLDLDYSYNNFHMTQYPVLSTAPMHDASGRLKSYTDPVLRLGKTNYYMSAQWSERYIDLLLDWIWANR